MVSVVHRLLAEAEQKAVCRRHGVEPFAMHQQPYTACCGRKLERHPDRTSVTAAAAAACQLPTSHMWRCSGGRWLSQKERLHFWRRSPSSTWCSA